MRFSAESFPKRLRFDVMNLKTLDAPAQSATPAVSLQDFMDELAICFRITP
jgi:hypothetical protein